MPAALDAICTLNTGSPRAGSLFLAAMVFVGIDDALDQRMAHDIGAFEKSECDAPDVREHSARLDEPALLAAGEIDLRDVAGDDRLGAEPDAGEEHLHLLGRGVLRLVQYDERMIERAPAHECE